MNRRNLLLLVIILLAALACNLPISRPTGQSTPTANIPLLTAISATLPPTQPLPSSLPPPTALPSPFPRATAQIPTTAQPGVAKPVQLHNPYAVVLVAENDVLNVRQAPGAANPILARLPPTATGVQLTGQEQAVTDERWVEITLPAGQAGWVNAIYLTEQVPGAVFCADPQVDQLIAGLRLALTHRDGELLSSLVSPAHGLDVTYFHTGSTANYSPVEARWVFQSDYATDWGAHPASGLKVNGSFQEIVLPDLLDVLGVDYQVQCNNPVLGGGNYTYLWPARYHNIHYLVLQKPGPPGNELAWRTWITGFEYVGGRPYLFALVHLFWEP